MKFTVTLRVTNEFTIELSAKNEEFAEEKAQKMWHKMDILLIDTEKMGNFQHENEEIEFEVDEL